VPLAVIGDFDTVDEANRALISIRKAIEADLGWDFNAYEKQCRVESGKIPQTGLLLLTDSRQLARFARFYLKEAVLDVLLSAAETDTPELGPAEISRRLGIQPVSRGPGSKSYPIVHGVLDELFKENRVESVESRQTWIIAPEEVQRRARNADET